MRLRSIATMAAFALSVTMLIPSRGNAQDDAFIVGELVGHDLLKQSFSPSEVATLVVHPKKIAEAPMYLIMSRNHPEAPTLLARFKEGIRLLKDSGEYEALLRNYR